MTKKSFGAGETSRSQEREGESEEGEGEGGRRRGRPGGRPSTSDVSHLIQPTRNSARSLMTGRHLGSKTNDICLEGRNG